MASLNKVLLMGNITRDPELKTLPNGTMVAEFGLAVSRKWKGQDGQAKEEVTFTDCSCFGKTAEVIAQYKKKGDPLFVEGRLKLDQWEAQDGSKRTKMRIVVESFQFLNRSQPQGDSNDAPRQQRSAGPTRTSQRPNGQQKQAANAAPQDEYQGEIEDADLPF